MRNFKVGDMVRVYYTDGRGSRSVRFKKAQVISADPFRVKCIEGSPSAFCPAAFNNDPCLGDRVVKLVPKKIQKEEKATATKFKEGDRVLVYGRTNELRRAGDQIYACYEMGAAGVVSYSPGNGDGEVAVELLDGTEVSVHEKQLRRISKTKSAKKKGSRQ